jgi:hypothetical protein
MMASALWLKIVVLAVGFVWYVEPGSEARTQLG